MAAEVKLRLDLRNVYGDFLRETVDVILHNQVLSGVKRASANVKAKVDIPGLEGGPHGRYRIEIDPPSYQYLGRSDINLKASGITEFPFTFPIDPEKVTGVNFKPHAKLNDDVKTLLERSDKVLDFEGKKGKDLYDSLDDIRRAGLMNIAVKLEATRLTNGRTALSYVQQLNELRGDRFFAVVPKALREETKHSVDAGIFDKADGSLHHPPPGFSPAGSFKTSDRYGNLQLTFFMNGNDCVADIDIDDAGGFEHIFQVLRNKFSGKPTHPYNIHEILVYRQKLDPGYRFVL